MSNIETPNNVLLLGNGVEKVNRINLPSYYDLSAASYVRTLMLLTYYHQNEQAFESKDASIVISGGWPQLASKMKEAPPEEEREAPQIVNILMQHGIPAKLIQQEANSASTIGNFEEVIRRGFFAGKKFTNENPLLLVASTQQAEYRAKPLARAAFGIDEHHGIQVLAAERVSLRHHAKEVVGRVLTLRAIEEVQPRPFDAEDMHAVDVRFRQLVKDPVEFGLYGLSHVRQLFAEIRKAQPKTS